MQRGAAGLAAGVALDAGWESAVAALKAPLDAAFEALPAAAPLLALKDYLFLACTALGELHCLQSAVIRVCCGGAHSARELACPFAASSKDAGPGDLTGGARKACRWGSCSIRALQLDRDAHTSRQRKSSLATDTMGRIRPSRGAAAGACGGPPQLYVQEVTHIS